MKRFITLLMALAIIASLCVVGVSADAAQAKQLLVLGDSISTGYGLDNYISGGSPYECLSYANMIAKALGLEGGSTYINQAVNGDTSEDLKLLLPVLEADIKKSDMIIITIGGNDLLQSIPLVASAVAGRSITNLNEAVNVLTNAAPEKYAALAQNADFQAKMGAVLTKYSANLAAIATDIKAKAPAARVIVLKQYNPMKNVLGLADFATFADTMIGGINTAMDTVSKTFGFETIDIPSVININAAGLTNILDMDIHPNGDGHVEMAKLIASYLGLTLDLPEETTVEVTDAPVTTESACWFEWVAIDEEYHCYKCPVCDRIDTRGTHTFEGTKCSVCGYDKAETEPETTPMTDPSTEAPEVTTEAQLEAPGCLSSVSGAAVIIACACAFVFIKKK